MTDPAGGGIGAYLRGAREQSGLSLRQIADSTKLGVRTLDALEKNRVAQLPGGIYRRAIVRAYASEIGLDPEQTLRAFLALNPQDAPDAHPATVEHVPAERRRFRALVSVLGALIPAVLHSTHPSRATTIRPG